MTTWTSIPDTNLEVGKPTRSIDGLALRDNVLAAAEGASGAPEPVAKTGAIMPLLSEKIVSVVAAVNFTDSDFDWTLYDRIIIVGEHVTIATNARYFTARLSEDGSTFYAGATDYDGQVTFTNSGAEGAPAPYLLLTDTGNAIGNTADYTTALTLIIHTPNNTGRIKQIEWDISYRTSTGDPNRALGSGFLRAFTSPLRGIRLRLNDDSNFSGTFRAYGFKHSDTPSAFA
jgi:hypothetical protein